MLTPADLLNKMDLWGSPLHTTKQSQLDALSLLYPLPKQIWQADRIRPWLTKYGIIEDCNHHHDSWLDKRSNPIFISRISKILFRQKNQFLIFLALTWKGYNWTSLNPLHHPGLCERLIPNQPLELGPGRQQLSSNTHEPEQLLIKNTFYILWLRLWGKHRLMEYRCSAVSFGFCGPICG